MPEKYCLVAGLGSTGQSIARWLRNNHRPFIALDTRPRSPKLENTAATLGAETIYFETLPESAWQHISTIISSPGIPPSAEFLCVAKERNIPIVSDIECFAHSTDSPVIAITGTNGKSTVTSLVGQMAKAAAIKTAIAGNIGTPVLDLVSQADENYQLWVLELSSYQLERTSSLAPVAACILNISPDHIQWHGSMPAYIQAKQRIYHHAQTIIYNRDDPQTTPEPCNADQACVSFGLSAPQGANEWGIIQESEERFLSVGQKKVLNVNALKPRGKHMWQNALAACALASSAHIPLEAICRVLRDFDGLEHRTEWVRCLDHVDWVNDSKGTNVGATISALEGIGPMIQGKIILLAGGVGKGCDYQPLQASASKYVRNILCFGQDAEIIYQQMHPQVSCYRVADMAAAIEKAKSLARPQDTVLLSPACASFDMFNNFQHRGDVFKSLVHAL